MPKLIFVSNVFETEPYSNTFSMHIWNQILAYDPRLVESPFKLKLRFQSLNGKRLKCLNVYHAHQKYCNQRNRMCFALHNDRRAAFDRSLSLYIYIYICIYICRDVFIGLPWPFSWIFALRWPRSRCSKSDGRHLPYLVDNFSTLINNRHIILLSI